MSWTESTALPHRGHDMAVSGVRVTGCPLAAHSYSSIPLLSLASHSVLDQFLKLFGRTRAVPAAAKTTDNPALFEVRCCIFAK